MNKIYYFAYGSNMYLSRLEDRVGEVKKISNYILKGYKLIFNAGSFHWSYANVEKSEDPQDFVEGVLYELTDKQMSKLDTFEGYPYSYQKFYLIENNFIIYGYWATNPMYLTNGFPTIDYYNYLLLGSAENNLEYTFNKLIQFETDIIKRKRKNINFNLLKLSIEFNKLKKRKKNDTGKSIKNRGSKQTSIKTSRY